MSHNLTSSSLFGLAETLNRRELSALLESLDSGRVAPGVSAKTVERLVGIRGQAAQSIALLLASWKGQMPLLAECLRAVVDARERVLAKAEKIEITWTGGVRYSLPTRTTFAVIKEMIASAKDRITVIGYEITDGAKPVFNLLALKKAAGVQVTMILDRAEDQFRVIQRLWKPSMGYPEIYAPKGEVRLHAKLLLVDGIDLLVTSANLSYSGLMNNIEIGLRVRGDTASRIDSIVNRLISENSFRRMQT